MSKLRSVLLGLLLVLGVALAALWLVGGVPPTAVPRLLSLPPDATVRVGLHSPGIGVTTNSLRVVHIGDIAIEEFGEPVDGIAYEGGGLSVSGLQIARLEGQVITVKQGPYTRLYGPLDGSRITQDETGQFVLDLDENLSLALQQAADDLRAVRAGVTNTQTAALLDQAVQHVTAAVSPMAWRDTLRLQPASGSQVFTALQDAWTSLRVLRDDPRLVESLGEDGVGRSAVTRIASKLLVASHTLARAAIEEAQAAGVPPEVWRQAEAEEYEGNRASSGDQPRIPEALQHYYTAWQLAVQAMPQVTPTP